MEVLQTRGLRPKPTYDLGTPWADNRIESSSNLAGRRVSVTLDDGTRTHTTSARRQLSAAPTGLTRLRSALTTRTELRPEVFFVQIPTADHEETTSLVLNFPAESGVLVRNTLVYDLERPNLRQVIWPFVLTGSGGILPEITDELVGKRAYAEYADGHTAEHIYVNPRRFGWQGLGKFEFSGSELDDSTTGRSTRSCILLTWVEEWQAVAACLLMDFEQLRNTGILFGRDDHGKVHTLCGAKLSKLGEIVYPAGYEPQGVPAGSDRSAVLW